MFSCLHCQDWFYTSPDFPFCRQCLLGLLECPPSCDQCLQIDCSRAKNAIRDACDYPWRTNWIPKNVRWLRAQYLLHGHTHRLIRTWKKRQGYFCNQRILRFSARHLKLIEKFQPEALLPVPQSISRAWDLQSSPAYLVAKKISQALEMPIDLSWVTLKNSPRKLRPQAKSYLTARLERKNLFEINKSKKYQKVLLVDDIVTSGSTLKILSDLIGAYSRDTELAWFALGYRPPRAK